MKKRYLSILLALIMVFSLVQVAMAASGDSEVVVVESDKSFIETVGVRFKESFKMVFVEGGTFTLGWEEGTPGEAPDDTIPVPGVTVSDYWIAETVVTTALWNAVMGGTNPTNQSTRNNARTSSTFYDVNEFFARLYVLTGKVYYMPTEAQWEYAAKGGKPGQALGHNLMPYPSTYDELSVAGTGAGTGAVKQTAPNILGIYNFLTSHGEWTWNPWNTTHIGGVDPIGIESPIHSQKTRRGGLSSTGHKELTSRLIRSIDGSGPSFRMALSADQSSPLPGMPAPRDIHVPKLDDRDTPNSYRDPRWVTGDNMVWEGNYQGYGGAAMKVWETGEVVLRPHNFNGYDPGDVVGQWYSFNNYAMVIIPNADSPNPDKSRILIPYMFLDQFTVSTINDRKNTHTADKGVVWPDIYMAPTGRLELKTEASLKASVDKNPTAAPNPPEQFGQDYQAHPYFGGTYDLIDKPVVPGLVALEDLEAGVGIVDAKHVLYNFANGNTAAAFPSDEGVRSQDPAVVDGPEMGWWMGYGFGGIHTYRKDIDLNGNLRFSVYEAAAGTNITPQSGSLARGPWYTVNDVFLRIQINAAGTAFADYLYIIVPDMEGNVLNTDNYPFRHLSYQSYERGDSRIFHLRMNADIERHPYEMIGTTGNGGMGNTTWRVAPSARTTCPGIPGAVDGTRIQCGNTVDKCTCQLFCIEHQIHDDCSIAQFRYTLAADKSSYKIGDKATVSVYLTSETQDQVTSLDFALSYDNSILTYDAVDGLSGYSSSAGASVVAFTRAGGATAIPDEGLLVATIRFTVTGSGETALSIVDGATASSALAPMPGDKNPASPGNTVVIKTNVVDGKVSFIENSVYNAAPIGFKILVLELNGDAIENATYRYVNQALLWSVKYNAYVAMVDDEVTAADALAGVNLVTDGSKNYAITYSGDIVSINDSANYPVNASDAQTVYALYMGQYTNGFNFDEGGMPELARFEADVNGDGTVNLVDVKVIQIIALALVTGG